MRTIKQHNQPLREQMQEDGFIWFSDEKSAYFKNPDGSYFGFPTGYITGPTWAGENGTPTPWYCSVRLPDECWAQRSFKTCAESVAWALEYVQTHNLVEA